MILALLGVLAVAAVVSVLYRGDRGATPTAEAPPAAKSPPSVASAPAAPRYPIVPSPGAQPPLDMSDTTLVAGLEGVIPDAALSAYLERSNVVRRIVATVDNIPRRNAPPALWPVKPAAGGLSTTTQDGRVLIAETNRFRYLPYVKLLESVNTPRLVELYRRHYPLFEQAYRELGFPAGHFNDRVVEAIDVLMASPSLNEPPRLVQPKVLYQFADRDLEQLPAGQKLMLRIGPDNEARVKSKLTEIRAAITDPALVAGR
ncbi:MAG TPA: DUF3014 domain-containing protein [Casimicrobiaceae bacterium]